MTSSGDLSLPTAQSMSSVNVQRFDSSALATGADLVFTQTAAGQYLSFYWREADQYRLQPQQMVGQSMQQIFTPVALAPYLERVRQVLNYLIPVQFEYAFVVADQHLVFDITLSPVLMPHGIATTGLTYRCTPTALLSGWLRSSGIFGKPWICARSGSKP
jgi:hypothetical protein